MKSLIPLMLLALAAVVLAPTRATAETEPVGPVFLVIVPERIDNAWYWLTFADHSQHLVQTEIEKHLLREGLEVVDASLAEGLSSRITSLDELLGPEQARSVAEELGADYLILGQGTAGEGSVGHAYGVRVVRATADVTARIIRVEDARVLDVFDASAQEGGESIRAAGTAALKAAGRDIAGDLRRACRKLAADADG